MSRAAFLSLAAAAVFHLHAADPASLLLPRPARIEAMSGEGALSPVREVVADVGAPASGKEESYRMDIGEGGVTLTAPSKRGLVRARATLGQLRALVRPGEGLRAMRITDWPAMKWRGLLLDCGRNHVCLPMIFETIDFLSRYKYNVFHWHLTDYHGWRLESRRHPNLQSPKAFARQVGRYYTQAEFREVVAYAAERGVTIVPEIDVPGHSAAFRRAFGVERMDSPEVKDIVCGLIDELCSLADAETMPVVHLGTDEVRDPAEFVEDGWYDVWAGRVAANGRTVMGWWPGHALKAAGKSLQETWWETRPPTGPYVDAGCCYIDSFSPWSLLAQASFKSAGGWYKVDPGWLVGGEVAAWHDDPVETSGDVARDNALFPAIVLFSDMLWRGNDAHRPGLVFAPPSPGEDGFERMADLERRALAQRDFVLRDFPHPLQIVAQTQMRWKVEDESGRVFRENVPGATVYAESPRRIWGYPGIADSTSNTVVLTAEFASSRERDAAAFIELSEFHRSGGRSYGLPAKGAWNRVGATVTLNGEPVAPPEWNHPGAKGGELADVPWTDECAWLRPPTPIHLRKGVNRVVIRLPRPRDDWYWSASFLPVDGTRDHPVEIERLPGT